MPDQFPARQDRRRPGDFLRGKMSLASVGALVAAIFFASIGLTTWWAIGSQGRSIREGRVEQVTGIGHVLAQTVEIMLANNELSAVRRVVSETAQTYDLQRCRISLPNGQIVADSDPKQITLTQLPATWPGVATETEAETSRDGVRQVGHLHVPGRGEASLEIMAGVAPGAAAFRPLQTKIGIISIGTLVALLLLHRSMRLRVRAICAVRDALLDHETGDGCLSALEVNPDWGREAQAWNSLIRTTKDQREQLALRIANDAMGGSADESKDLQAACNMLLQGLILVERDLTAKYVNGAAAVLLQTDREALTGAEIASVVPDPAVLAAVREATEHPTRRRKIVEVELGEGPTASILRFIVRPVRRDDPGVAMMVIEDITQQRVAERSRGAFIANATHELRNPLTNIRLYTETAMDNTVEGETEQAQCLNVINQETHRLERMVTDILSVAQIEAGTLKLKTDDVSLGRLFDDLKADYALQAQEKNVDLVFGLPAKLPTIQADRDKLMVGLHNLIGNALKYTPENGSVTVAVTAENDQLVVEVTDTGIGIDEADAAQVFEKFYRARDKRLTGIPGSGLGLAIAREVIRLHGGDITLRSEIDKGSTFMLELPIHQEAA